MESRMPNPAVVLPNAMKALHALDRAAKETGVDTAVIDLAILRASQINGCSVCVQMHASDLKRAGESDERIWAVGAWRETTCFTDAERAALALAEAVTRTADTPDPVTDEIWADVAQHFDEQQLAGLLIALANINVWNRLNLATHQIAGQAWAAA
jgi:AhpD family alkylhydroperoxidase